jgi:hypothetical protein
MHAFTGYIKLSLWLDSFFGYFSGRKPGSLRLQRIRNWPRRTRVLLVLAVLTTGILLLTLAPRLPIGSHYHDFADKRTILRIPNALDVLSNIPFVVVGVWAVAWLSRAAARTAFLDERERIAYLVFFAGVTLTGFGSYWYHISPSDARLPWDLIPMTCSFVSVISAIVMERISPQFGFVILFPLIILGISTIVYWYLTGDYKFYLFLQFFSPVILALVIGMFPPRYSGMGYLITAFALYVIAKLFEAYDYPVYRFNGLISGHALKHVTAAVSCFCIFRMLQMRGRHLPPTSTRPMVESADRDKLSWARQ